MSGNTFGRILRLSTFGESHSEAVGGILDGFPPNITIDYELLYADLKRRKTNGNFFSSPRTEEDEVVFMSGIYEGKSLGTPIGFYVLNKNAQSKDYKHLQHVFRPSHADYTYTKKYGIRDHRGGGRASARETVARVVGGAFAKMLLRKHGINLTAFVTQIGKFKAESPITHIKSADIVAPLCFPDTKQTPEIMAYLSALKDTGDTAGGIITCVINNCPVGLGEPVFDKLQARLAYAMMGIPAINGFEFGSGFAGAQMNGSKHNDSFYREGSEIKTRTNFSGGIQGGISNGQQIYFSVAFKPVSSVKMSQQTIDEDGHEISLKIEGRHDVCPVPRAVPIVEAMAALVIADMLLLNQTHANL